MTQKEIFVSVEKTKGELEENKLKGLAAWRKSFQKDDREIIWRLTIQYQYS